MASDGRSFATGCVRPCFPGRRQGVKMMAPTRMRHPAAVDDLEEVRAGESTLSIVDERGSRPVAGVRHATTDTPQACARRRRRGSVVVMSIVERDGDAVGGGQRVAGGLEGEDERDAGDAAGQPPVDAGDVDLAARSCSEVCRIAEARQVAELDRLHGEPERAVISACTRSPSRRSPEREPDQRPAGASSKNGLVLRDLHGAESSSAP